MSENEAYSPSTYTHTPPTQDLAPLSGAELLTPSEELRRVEIPEKDGVVFLKEPNAGQVLDFIDADGEATALLKLIGQLTVDQSGGPVFTSQDMTRIANLPIPVFNRLSQAVLKMVDEIKPAPSEGEGSEDQESPEGNG